MRASHSFSRSPINSLSLLLVYTLTISLIAPFAPKRVNAAPVEPAPAPAAKEKRNSKRRDGELIVRFREGVSEQDKNRLVEDKGAQRGRRLRGRSRLEKINLRQGQDMDTLAEQLRSNPAIELVEPNFLISHDEVTPGDPRFAGQWALKNTGQMGGQTGADIQAVPAWETTTGAPTTVIAVVDSGIDFTHPDLQNNQWTNNSEQQNSRDDDNNGLTDDVHGWDWVRNSEVVRDEQGHGTSVAGIIAAQGNNSIGITGVMWRASLMSLRVLDNTGTGDVANAVEAIDYAVDHGAQVINCSWGTDDESLALKDAIERVGTSGVVVVSSAGNSGRDIESEPYYPASFGLSNQIAVASTDSSDHLASWSNYGANHVTVAAPGTDILTTKMGGDYITVTGTSASTPLVAGVVGLVKTQRWWLSAAGTRAAIVDGARHLDELNGKVSSGGVVSASGALAAMQGPDTPPPGSGHGGNGNNGGSNGNGNGNGSGNNGNNNNPTVQPPTPGFGSGGSGQNGGFSTTPPPVTQGVPGSPLPNLDEARRSKSITPRAPAPIHADLCPDCDPGGGTPPPAGGSDPYFATARVRPQNETGDPGINLGSRNFNWGLPLVSLPGRAGLDVNIGMVYNSLVWTKQGNSIMYNADRGFPSPGFRLGVPTLESQYINQDDVITALLLVLPSGQRVQLKQVGTSNVYESNDSSYIQLLDYNLSFGGSAVVRDKAGTQYLFTYPPGVSGFRCTQVKDRNGNYITINYNMNGQISTIVDTLGRTLTFNYVNDFLDKITQTWNGQTHVWATFGYGSLYISTNFPGMSYLGPQGYITVLTQVGLSDGTRYNFSYTSFGQVYKISHYAADQHLLSYTGYNLPGSEWLGITAQSDCPRFTEQHDWAENWNNNQETITYYSVDPNSAGGNQPAWSQVTTPDNTVYKELFSTSNDWTKGLTTGTEVWVNRPGVGLVKTKWTTTAWTQDDTSLAYQKNPRPYDMSVYDEAGNRRRTDIIYTSYGLPGEVREYSADGSGFGGFMRRTYTGYKFDSAYIDRHIIGLVDAIHVVDENNNYVTKITYDYDRGGEYLSGTPQATIQHDDANYGAGFVYGRGNQTDVWRWDVTDINNTTKTSRLRHTGYNTNGSAVFTRDALNHQTSISYTDSFSDGVNHNTFAYPTTVTDPDNYSSTAQYNYDFGATTRTQDPKGAVTTIVYDAAGRTDRITNQINGAYQRWVYNPYGDIATYMTVQSGQPEAFSVTYFDGAGRVRSMGSDLPNSSGGYTGQFTLYDIMGRPSQVSNPAEMTNLWAPTGDDAPGWVWTYQSYDWKGRPLLTTNPDGTTREASYNACGCAGGDTVTFRDERGRRRRLTNDIMGRLKRVEELNWDQTVYSTTNYTYNGRNQITSTNQAGQVRSFEYDGHSRLWRRTTPEQGQTTYTYFPDDTAQTVTDARGATSTFAYNNRHLPTSITYGVPSGVAATPNVSFGYDEVGNRTSMTDGLGSVAYHYDQLSRMDWEERTFSGLGTYRLSYAYNLSGELTSLTNPWGVQVGYNYDKTGRVAAVTGAGYAGVSSYINSLGYRAFGGVKQITYGNTKQLSVQYDNRLRMTRWDVQNVLGYQYSYSYFNENTGRVTFASQLYDHTLDRSYDYDQVGRMWGAHSGREARWHTGQESYSGADGPYAQNQAYDVWGNTVQRNGWGGWNSSETVSYTNNRRNDLTYDAAGNVIFDGSTLTYDATGQQASAYYSGNWDIHHSYDGDRLRSKKVENGVTTYYLRSSVLGGQTVAELNGSGVWMRGYVYLGNQLLAIQQNLSVQWTHQDPVTKSQRLTDGVGNVVSTVELDPWGGETYRSSNQALQPHRFTTYERDYNGRDEAQMRQHHGWFRRFDQPDPYSGSYDLSDPQSFNRYSYVQNDPVNFIDPSGLQMAIPGFCGADSSFGQCYGDGAGFWGGYGNGSRGGFGGSRYDRDENGQWDPYDWWFHFGSFQQNAPTIKGATPVQQRRFNDAYAEMMRRLEENDGNNPCAKLFGGLEKAKDALNKTKWSFGRPHNAGAAAETKGNKIKIDPTGSFMNTSGSVMVTIDLVSNGMDIIPTNITIEGNIEAAAFFLLHELGHRTNSLPDDAGSEYTSIKNNGKIYDACF